MYILQVEGSAHTAYQSFAEVSKQQQQRRKEPSPFDNPVADAFENEIACSMDALDKLGGDAVQSPMNSLTAAAEDEGGVGGLGGGAQGKSEDSVPLGGGGSQPQQSDFWSKFKNGRKVRDVASDEVRIMKKVLGEEGDEEEDGLVAALSECDWNVHHAIKLVKVKITQRL